MIHQLYIFIAGAGLAHYEPLHLFIIQLLRRVQDGARACAAGRLAQVQFVVVFSSISFN
eukprot:COSAG01_NODE_66537_length_269_cov_17.964706_1_plen_58_part_10